MEANNIVIWAALNTSQELCRLFRFAGYYRRFGKRAQRKVAHISDDKIMRSNLVKADGMKHVKRLLHLKLREFSGTLGTFRQTKTSIKLLHCFSKYLC